MATTPPASESNLPKSDETVAGNSKMANTTEDLNELSKALETLRL